MHLIHRTHDPCLMLQEKPDHPQGYWQRNNLAQEAGWVEEGGKKHSSAAILLANSGSSRPTDFCKLLLDQQGRVKGKGRRPQMQSTVKESVWWTAAQAALHFSSICYFSSLSSLPNQKFHTGERDCCSSPQAESWLGGKAQLPFICLPGLNTIYWWRDKNMSHPCWVNFAVRLTLYICAFL